MRVVQEGVGCHLLRGTARCDGKSVAPADAIDPEYEKLIRQALASDVEALAHQAVVTPRKYTWSAPCR